MLPTVVLHTCFRLWEAHPTLLGGQFIFDVCRWTGIAAVVLGGLGALGQRRWGALVGYVTLVDWGAGLIALGLGTRAGAEQMVQMLVWRAFSLLLVGVGWGALFKAAGQRDELELCLAPVRQHPLSVLALVLGLLSLAGFPLSPGGLGRWSLLDRATLSQPLSEWPTPTLVLVMAGAAASVGIVGTLGACLGRTPPPIRVGVDGRRMTNGPSEGDKDQQEQIDDEAAENRAGGRSEERRERWAWRRQRAESLLDTGISLLALWVIGGFFLRPGPWIELARFLVGDLAFPGG
jgi:hypothetical protein